MDDANEESALVIGPGSEEDGEKMNAMVEAIRLALVPHVKEESFGEDLAIAMSSVQIYAGMLFGIAVSVGLETATEARMNQMGQMLCMNFDYGIQRALSNINANPSGSVQ